MRKADFKSTFAISAPLSHVDSSWMTSSNALSIPFEICSRLCYFLVVLTDALLLSTCRLFWASPPLLSSAGLEVACPCKVLRCDLTAVLSATLCQSPLGGNELRLGLGGMGSTWTGVSNGHSIVDCVKQPCNKGLVRIIC